MMKSKEQRRDVIVRAWIRWLALFIPFMAVILVASAWLDFNLILAGLIVILAGTLLYQRHINKRAWKSIMWGVHAPEE